MVFTTDTDPGGPFLSLARIVTIERSPGDDVGALTAAPTAARATRLDDLVLWLQENVLLLFPRHGGCRCPHSWRRRASSPGHQVVRVVGDKWGVVADV